MSDSPDSKLAIIILAAGLGKRMLNPELPKVLAEMKNKPLIEYVLDSSAGLNADKIVLVVGHHKQKVIDKLKTDSYNGVEFVSQDVQLGTGHAVDQAREALSGFDGLVMILAGDVPLLSAATLTKFVENHLDSESGLSVLSAIAPDPYGYGRIVRSDNGEFLKITEEKDADEKIKIIDEINSGVYLVQRDLLFSALAEVSNENAQGEYYLTDIISILAKRGVKVSAFDGADFDEIHGVNSPEDLRDVEETYDKKNN